MWSIDTKIKMMKRGLPKWLQQKKYDSYYDNEKRKVIITYLLKKNKIIFEIDMNSMKSSVCSAGCEVFFFSQKNWLGFIKPSKTFLNFLKLSQIESQI